MSRKAHSLLLCSALCEFTTALRERENIMANKTETIVMGMAETAAEKLGYYVVDVSYKKEAGEWHLRIFIDKDGGVGIDDCEKMSGVMSDMLDANDPTDTNYILEVSSPGADRTLTKEREFLYYIGREVDVKLFAAVDGVKEFSGILEDYKNSTAVITTENGTVEVKKSDAAYIKLHFEF